MFLAGSRSLWFCHLLVMLLSLNGAPSSYLNLLITPYVPPILLHRFWLPCSNSIPDTTHSIFNITLFTPWHQLIYPCPKGQLSFSQGSSLSSLPTRPVPGCPQQEWLTCQSWLPASRWIHLPSPILWSYPIFQYWTLQFHHHCWSFPRSIQGWYIASPQSHPHITSLNFLSKIHKLGNNGRSIVAFHTEHVSTYINSHLQHIVKFLPSHIKDTNHFTDIIWSLSLPTPLWRQLM